MSSTLRLTRSQPLSLLSIATLNMARSHVRPSTWSFERIAQTCLCRRGGFARSVFPYSRVRGRQLEREIPLDPAWRHPPVLAFEIFPFLDDGDERRVRS